MAEAVSGGALARRWTAVTVGALVVPDGIFPVLLPPYVSRLHPVETVCQYFRANRLAIEVVDAFVENIVLRPDGPELQSRRNRVTCRIAGHGARKRRLRPKLLGASIDLR